MKRLQPLHPRPAWAQFWGKTDRQRPVERFHLLAYHCLDVAAVAHELLRRDRPTLERLAAQLEIPAASLRALIVFWLALHDAGKFGTSFQLLAPSLPTRLGRPKLAYRAYNIRHDTLGYVAWERAESFGDLILDEGWFLAYEDEFDAHEAALDLFLVGIFGHHGRPIDPGAYGSPELHFQERETREAMNSFARELREVLLADFQPETLRWTPALLTNLKRLSWSLAGLYVLCDWIGSDEEHFAFEEEPFDLAEYWEHRALPSARRALDARHLHPKPPRPHGTFEELFPEMANRGWSPRPMQEAALEIEVASRPQLYILEDETGSGKTEAALLLAQALMRQGQAQGVYVGLPTTATADAMYGRLATTYRRLFLEEAAPSIVLAHGRRHLSEDFQRALRAGATPRATYDDEGTDAPGEAQCAAFFAERRHLALYADVGVGTIDQALLGALPARFQSLRLFALGRRVLIVDEVHAYDTYTHELLCNLLRHHAAQGGSAILLSATLPMATRRELIEAFWRGRGRTEELSQPLSRAYPLLTRATRDAVQARKIEPSGPAKQTEIVFLPRAPRERGEDDEAAIASWIVDRMRDGSTTGCACWIRNTVQDAIDAARSLRAHPDLDPDRVILFHARMALCDRLAVEERVLRHFGPESTPEQRAGWVVVATQVIEQSLDLDFDELLTDLCPIELLLQRLGRYRRHRRDRRGARLEDSRKPDGRGARTLHVLAPGWSEAPDADWYEAPFPRSAYVYPHHEQLWLAMDALRQRGTITLPDQSRALLEEVYAPERDIPLSLEDLAFEAELEDMLRLQQGDFIGLTLKEGYDRDTDPAGRWLSDTRTPTRLGELTSTLRLARVTSSGRLEPWASGSAHPWAMSEVRVRETQIYEERIPETLEEAAARARETMPDGGEYTLLLPLRREQEQWRAEALNGRNQPVAVTYDDQLGLHVELIAQ